MLTPPAPRRQGLRGDTPRDTHGGACLQSAHDREEDSLLKSCSADSEQTRQGRQKEDREKTPMDTQPHLHLTPPPLPCAVPPTDRTTLCTQTTDPGMVKSGTDTAAKKENISGYGESCRAWAWAPAHNAVEEKAGRSEHTPTRLLSLQPWAGQLGSRRAPSPQVETGNRPRGCRAGGKPFC